MQEVDDISKWDMDETIGCSSIKVFKLHLIATKLPKNTNLSYIS